MADEPKPEITPREIVPAGTQAVREGFSGTETLAGGDLSAGIDFKSQLEAAMILASHKPRSLDKFRTRMIADCRDHRFAEAALYNKPVGRKKNPVTGEWEQAFATNFSVRFIEAALRAFANTRVFEFITYEDDKRARIHVAVIDVEDNNGYGTDRMIEKVVERKKPDGRVVRGHRPNSYGDSVFLVDATADEFRNLYGAERSKLRRDNGQRLLPFHILAELREEIDKAIENEAAQHPDAARNRVIDAFKSMGIGPEMLALYLEKPTENIAANDLTALRAIYVGLKDGEFTWNELMRFRTEPAEGEPEPEKQRRNKVKDAILSRAKPEPKKE